MKRAIYVFVAALMLISVLVFTGCKTDSAATPEDVACKYLVALAIEDFNEADKYCLIKSEQLLKPTIEKLMEYYSITESEAYSKIIEKALEDLEEEIEISKMPVNFSQFASIDKEIAIKMAKEKYGEDYSINASIATTIDIPEEDKSTKLQELFDELGESTPHDKVEIRDIEDYKVYECQVCVKGSKDEKTSTVVVVVAKVGGAWKVLYAEVSIF